MKTFKYSIDDSYPNITGQVSYAGSVDTALLSAKLLANGSETGAFAGSVTINSFVSDNDLMSTVDFTYVVSALDTAVEGSYKLCLRVTHSDASVETITTGDIAKVATRCGYTPVEEEEDS